MKEKIITHLGRLRLIEKNKINFNNQGEKCKGEIIKPLIDSLAAIPESCYCKTTKIFANINRNNQYDMF